MTTKSGMTPIEGRITNIYLGDGSGDWAKLIDNIHKQICLTYMMPPFMVDGTEEMNPYSFLDEFDLWFEFVKRKHSGEKEWMIRMDMM